MRGYVKEVFTSIQGEGIKIGQRQSFIRFYGCNLSCNYCDTPDTQKMQGPFNSDGQSHSNPVDVTSIVERVREHQIALTGGEPLLQIDFLCNLCDTLKRAGKHIYLDTNATLPNELEQVLGFVDTIALDFKIPTATGRPKLWNEHSACLQIASQKQVFVKIVINENVLPNEIETACSIISQVNSDIPLIIQPVHGRLISNILDIQHQAMTILGDVRIIPQIHKYLKLR